MADHPTIDSVVASHPFGTATAVKRGRRKEWPYVPIVDHGTHTEQIRAKAFATRAEAVAHAVVVIDYRRVLFRQQLQTPRYRALRRQWGLPEELA